MTAGVPPTEPLRAVPVPAPSPGALSASAAARRLGITTRAMRRVAAEGRVRANLVEGRWLIDAADLARYAAGRLGGRSLSDRPRGRPGDAAPGTSEGTVPPELLAVIARLSDLADRLEARLATLEAGDTTPDPDPPAEGGWRGWWERVKAA